MRYTLGYGKEAEKPLRSSTRQARREEGRPSKSGRNDGRGAQRERTESRHSALGEGKGEGHRSLLKKCVTQYGDRQEAPWNGWVNLGMLQIYADAIVSLLEALRALEKDAATWGFGARMMPERWADTHELLRAVADGCKALNLSSATKQMLRIAERMGTVLPSVEFSSLLTELRIRVKEDLQDKIFYCVTDTVKIQRFFRPPDAAIDHPDEVTWRRLVPKRAGEILDPKIVRRFPSTAFDIEEAALCTLTSRSTACVFHLMRVVEVGLLAVAKLADIQDPKPSWGAILGKLDKYAFHAEYKELPVAVQPHRDLIKEILPKMHAIQHAWRNTKVAHVENKLIPVETITEQEADEIMTAVHAFMRILAAKLPST